jgi:hypothetical protein
MSLYADAVMNRKHTRITLFPEFVMTFSFPTTQMRASTTVLELCYSQRVLLNSVTESGYHGQRNGHAFTELMNAAIDIKILYLNAWL